MKQEGKSPVRLTVGYGLWDDSWATTLVQRFEKDRQEYISISDIGTGRMSKRMAEKFVIFLKNAIISGSISVSPLTEGYAKSKGGNPIGVQTGEVLDSITAFRTNIGGEKKHTGWVVSIKEKQMTTRTVTKKTGETSSYKFPTWYKLSWLEYGTIEQVPRPIIARGFEMFVDQGWVKKVVEDMISRGIGMTEARRNMYSGGGEE